LLLLLLLQVIDMLIFKGREELEVRHSSQLLGGV
jgi:hypothetical protein